MNAQATRPTVNRDYQVLSALLRYPDEELIQALPELREALAGSAATLQEIEPLLGVLQSQSGDDGLIALQEQYVATFDRNARHSLHLFEHIHGESRDRGQAMVDLLDEYRQHGFDINSAELPDHVPLFLEFLAHIDSAEAERLLGDAIHVLAHLGRKLRESGSAYHHVFARLEQLSPVAAQPLTEPPVRDMDEALETFGPGADGVEPLLKPGASCGMSTTPAVAPVHLHRRAAASPSV